MDLTFSKVAAFFNQFHTMPESVLINYLALWKEELVPRKSILTEAGSVQKDIYFVLEGIQKSYYLRDGKQYIIAFTYAPSLTGIPESFFMQSPSRYFLETITASHLLRISHADHVAFMSDHRDLETLMRKMTEMVLAGVIERHHELMAFDMESRFRSFLKRSPHLINMVSQKDLASYLRMDATNISKLLNSIKI